MSSFHSLIIIKLERFETAHTSVGYSLEMMCGDIVINTAPLPEPGQWQPHSYLSEMVYIRQE